MTLEYRMEPSPERPSAEAPSDASSPSAEVPMPAAPRISVPVVTTWKLEDLFVDTAGWDRSRRDILAAAERCSVAKATFGASGAELYQCLREIDRIEERLELLSTYADLRFYADARDDEAGVLREQAEATSASVGATLAFVEPAILALGAARIEAMIAEHPALEEYRFYFTELERNRAHVLSAEGEALVSGLAPLAALPEGIRDALHDGDMTFATRPTEQGPVTPDHGTIEALLQNPDRGVRRAAYESYADGYTKTFRTFGAIVTAQAQTSLAFARARRFESTFDQALFGDDLSPDVYRNAIASCREHYPLFQRYFEARARILGVEKIAEYDLMASMSRQPPEIPYERGIELVLGALTPLGSSYLETARHGLTEGRWVDVHPREGKYSNPFSIGPHGTHSRILLNYNPSMIEVGTLAHELGHAMHSEYTNRAQPMVYASHAMSVAETASNLNQVLLRAHILESCDRETALAVLDEAFYFAHRYLFLMPTLSRVEHLLHSTYARGGALSADDLATATITAFSRAYGETVEFDRSQIGNTWARFGHLHSPYYLFQYTIGISAAMSIGGRLLAGEPGLRERYIDFLSAGGSRSPRDLFAGVGVDIESPKPYRDAFAVVASYVDRLEDLARKS